jgi:hypothetical protein
MRIDGIGATAPTCEELASLNLADARLGDQRPNP